MHRFGVVAAVAVISFAAGAAVTGPPRTVSHDVLISDIRATSSATTSTATTTPTPTTTEAASIGEPASPPTT